MIFTAANGCASTRRTEPGTSKGSKRRPGAKFVSVIHNKLMIDENRAVARQTRSALDEKIKAAQGLPRLQGDQGRQPVAIL
jgi:hypothetical protein